MNWSNEGSIGDWIKIPYLSYMFSSATPAHILWCSFLCMWIIHYELKMLFHWRVDFLRPIYYPCISTSAICDAKSAWLSLPPYPMDGLSPGPITNKKKRCKCKVPNQLWICNLLISHSFVHGSSLVLSFGRADFFNKSDCRKRFPFCCRPLRFHPLSPFCVVVTVIKFSYQ